MFFESTTEYPNQYHETKIETEYYVHGYIGVIDTFKTLKEARELYAKEKANTGIAMITKKTTQVITLEQRAHVQGHL